MESKKMQFMIYVSNQLKVPNVKETDNSVFQFVTVNSSKIYSFQDIPFEIDGIYKGKGRKELQNQPKFKGFLGPMWNGYNQNGQSVIRYETSKAYNLHSM